VFLGVDEGTVVARPDRLLSEMNKSHLSLLGNISFYEAVRISLKLADLPRVLRRNIWGLYLPSSLAQMETYVSSGTKLRYRLRVNSGIWAVFLEALGDSLKALKLGSTDTGPLNEFWTQNGSGINNADLLNYMGQLSYIFGGPKAAQNFHEARDSFLGSFDSNPINKIRRLLVLNRLSEVEAALREITPMEGVIYQPYIAAFERYLAIQSVKRIEGKSHALFIAPGEFSQDQFLKIYTGGPVATLISESSTIEFMSRFPGADFYLKKGTSRRNPDFVSSLLSQGLTILDVEGLPARWNKIAIEKVIETQQWDYLFSYGFPFTGVNSILGFLYRIGSPVSAVGFDFYSNFRSHRDGYRNQVAHGGFDQEIGVRVKHSLHDIVYNWKIFRNLVRNGVVSPLNPELFGMTTSDFYNSLHASSNSRMFR